MKHAANRLLWILLSLSFTASSLGFTVRGASAAVSQSGDAAALQMSEVTWNTVSRAVASIQYEIPVRVSAYDAELIAKTLYGEARGCAELEQAAVVWCILNRADREPGSSVEGVITYPGQFMGYSPGHPVLPELYAVAEDVLRRHGMEKRGKDEVGRVLPRDYLWFSGDSRHNYFRNRYEGGSTWDWSLPNPYA